MRFTLDSIFNRMYCTHIPGSRHPATRQLATSHCAAGSDSGSEGSASPALHTDCLFVSLRASTVYGCNLYTERDPPGARCVMYAMI